MTRIEKSIRYSLGAALAFAGVSLIPLLSFGKDPITDTITQAKVNLCLNALTSCTTQCGTQATAAPGSYPVCMQNCTNQYSRCISPIARQVSSSKPDVTPRPQIAPSKTTPRPLPRKTHSEDIDKPFTRKSATPSSTIVKPAPTAPPPKKN